ncbi:hypothetical protein OAN21_01895 [Alphaproteobacteria bacterium]|nr:hypothetical protein [Alphaproteobacteria bacterium]
MKKTLVYLIVGISSLCMESFSGRYPRSRPSRTENFTAPRKASEIKSLLSHVQSPEDKLQVYAMWFDSLELKIKKADDDLDSSTISKGQYIRFKTEVTGEMKKVSKAIKKLGPRFKEAGEMYESKAAALAPSASFFNK